MRDWQTKALELLPELTKEIHAAETPMALWLDITWAFRKAYHEPRNEDLIRRVYMFSGWCLHQEGGQDAGNHLPTCVVVAFYEDIPTIQGAREDMPRWFDRDDVEKMKDIFIYHIGEKGFGQLMTLFPARKPDDKKSKRSRPNKSKRQTH